MNCHNQFTVCIGLDLEGWGSIKILLSWSQMDLNAFLMALEDFPVDTTGAPGDGLADLWDEEIISGLTHSLSGTLS